MQICPNCNTRLKRTMSDKGIIYNCLSCNGSLIGLGVLRRSEISQEIITDIWHKVAKSRGFGNRGCPHCGKVMTQISKNIQGRMVTLDICPGCQCIWFDPNEFKALPKQVILEEVKHTELSPKAREALARFQFGEAQRQEKDLDEAFAIGDPVALIFIILRNLFNPI